MKLKNLMVSAIALAGSLFSVFSYADQHVDLNRIGNMPLGNAEIVSFYDSKAYVTNANDDTVDIIDLNDPANPMLISQFDITPYGGGVNSVSVKNGVVAIAVEADVKQNPGVVVFLDAGDLSLLGQVGVGALPDMITFSPDGRYVITANEGEPDDDYLVDPEGSISVIDLQNGVVNATVVTVGFSDFNIGQPRHSELPSEVRIFGPGASVAQDLEPEYVAVSNDSLKAYVSLQENNAIAVVDLASASIDRIDALGFKNYNLVFNAIDASDRDAGINIQSWPVFGMYQPDSIAYYQSGSAGYVVTANEGDSRDYDGYSEEDRVDDLTLDAAVFPDAALLQQEENLGRLKITNSLGDLDGDGDFDEIYSYGARSFSIWNANTGQQVYDSANEFAQIIAADYPAIFNQNGPGEFDKRSDDKGAEPEALEVAEIGGRSFAFIGLERVGGIMIYDITNPAAPVFETYVPSSVIGKQTDDAPEGIKFVSQQLSPINRPLILVANEKSDNLAIYQLDICTVSALNFTGDNLNITGSCLDGGVDIYEQYEGQLRLVQQGVIVDQTASVAIDNIILDASYFVAVSGENTPINGLTATPLGSNVVSNIPVNSHLALLLMMLGIVIFAVNRRVL